MLESQDLIEKIIKELRTISGEMMIAKSMHNLDDDAKPENLEDLMKFIVRDAKASNDFIRVMTYNEGKYDAYLKMLDLLGFQYKENPENQ
jgi:hypothetical protein